MFSVVKIPLYITKVIIVNTALSIYGNNIPYTTRLSDKHGNIYATFSLWPGNTELCLCNPALKKERKRRWLNINLFTYQFLKLVKLNVQSKRRTMYISVIDFRPPIFYHLQEILEAKHCFTNSHQTLRELSKIQVQNIVYQQKN